MQPTGEHGEIAGDPEQGEARDQHAGDRARFESDLETAGERPDGGLRRAHVGAHRDVHADETGEARQRRADGKSDGDKPAKEITDDEEYDDSDDSDRGVLALEIGLRAFPHCPRYLLHLLAARVGRHDRLGRPDAIHDGEQAAGENPPQDSH